MCIVLTIFLINILCLSILGGDSYNGGKPVMWDSNLNPWVWFSHLLRGQSRFQIEKIRKTDPPPPNFTKPGMFSFFQPTSPISQPYIQTPLTITLLLIDLEPWFCMLKPHFRGRGIQWKHFRTCKTNRVARSLSRVARIFPFLRVWWQYEFYLT